MNGSAGTKKRNKKWSRWLSALAIVLALVVGFWLIPPSDIPATPAEPYVDLHVHVAGVGAGESGIFLSDQMLDNWKFPIYINAFGVSQDDINLYGDRIVIERLAQKIRESEFIDAAVVLALDGVVDESGELDRVKTQVYVPNEYLILELSKFDELFFGASINPYRHDAVERLDNVVENGAKLIKWIPNIMQLDPSDKRIIPFYKRMAQLGIPLLTHTGREWAFADADNQLGDPIRLELPLSLGVTVIAAHIATTGNTEGKEHFDRILPMFEKYPNLYADISSLTQINKRRYLQRALKVPGVTERLVYGSDWPLQFFPVVSPYFHLDLIGIRDAKAVRRQKNTWDRDVVLKKKMGVPESVFVRSRRILALEPAD